MSARRWLRWWPGSSLDGTQDTVLDVLQARADAAGELDRTASIDPDPDPDLPGRRDPAQVRVDAR